jgi:hypothetical protein
VISFQSPMLSQPEFYIADYYIQVALF